MLWGGGRERGVFFVSEQALMCVCLCVPIFVDVLHSTRIVFRLLVLLLITVFVFPVILGTIFFRSMLGVVLLWGVLSSYPRRFLFFILVLHFVFCGHVRLFVAVACCPPSCLTNKINLTRCPSTRGNRFSCRVLNSFSSFRICLVDDGKKMLGFFLSGVVGGLV